VVSNCIAREQRHKEDFQCLFFLEGFVLQYSINDDVGVDVIHSNLYVGLNHLFSQSLSYM